MDWFRKNKDWLITLAVFLFFGFILLLYNVFFKNHNQQETIKTESRPPTFELPARQDTSAGGADAQSGQAGESRSFLLSPGPGELFEKLENLSRQEFKKQTRDLPGMKVMWPAYFFSIRSMEEGKAVVLLDASQSGFGVTLLTTVDIKRYPEILSLERGRKIWLAAEITGVDPRGTGQFLLDTEYVRFDDYQPPSPKKQTEPRSD